MDPITYRAQVLSDIFERPKNYAVFAVFEKINACLCHVFSSEEIILRRRWTLLEHSCCSRKHTALHIYHLQFHIDPSVPRPPRHRRRALTRWLVRVHHHSRTQLSARRQFQGGVHLPRNSKTARLVSSSLHPILPDFIFGDKTV